MEISVLTSFISALNLEERLRLSIAVLPTPPGRGSAVDSEVSALS